MSVVERCAMQECLKEVAEEPIQSEFNSALGRYEKREVTLLLSLQVSKKLCRTSKFRTLVYTQV